MKLPKAYEPGGYEKDVYDLWEKSGLFVADPNSSKPHFSMAMPPPNETGTLHMGSALFVVLQDILARHARQQGKDVLWLPGTDHAALATNALMEKQLAEQGTDKHVLGREAYIARVKEFVGNNRDIMISQLRAMGASCDWTRLRYTLDEALNRCVNEVFVKMYKDGLIYRGHRIVNWDPKSGTTVSDDEVDHKEEKAPFYTLQYGPFKIGTARPETKFGDKYVVMHPDDKRYAQYKHGDTFEAEWINGPVKATVIKDEAVDPAFGTGVMTITPWHDHTDFEIAERHGLEKDQIIDFEGKLLPIAGEFAGMEIKDARPKIVEKLKAKNLLVSEDDYTHNIALNSRGKGVIEPQIKLQWFVDVNRPAVEWKGQLRSLKEVMLAVVEDGDIKIIPGRFEKIYFHWIDNLRDWCISRQIWWGHRVPVWYKKTAYSGQRTAGSEEHKDEIYVGVKPPEGSGSSSAKALEDKWEQDPDTLDTWFSSALWTWSTLVDQELAKDYSLSLNELLKKSLDFKTYHPTDVMETGWDILFFWVARMVLATTYATGQIPFKTVYLHGLVRTETGKKMSKSDPDSIIDPVDMINKYGTDALRLALASGTVAGNDQRLGEAKIIANRNFCNKLWNIARYVQESAGDNRGDPELKTIADQWILNMLSISADAIKTALENFKFNEAYDTLYHFVWDDLADWYIEASKAAGNPELLYYVLEQTLKLAHPYAPFVTETIWQSLQGLALLQGQSLQRGNLLAGELWPEIIKADKYQANQFELLKTVIEEARRVIAAVEVKKPKLYFKDAPILGEYAELVGRLGGLGGVEPAPVGYKAGLKLTNAPFEAWLDVDEKTAQSYRDKLKQQKGAAEKLVKTLEARLGNKSYVEKAPEELIEETKRQLEQEKGRLEAVMAEITASNNLP